MEMQQFSSRLSIELEVFITDHFRLGPGATRFNPGDRTGIGWIHSACGLAFSFGESHEMGGQKVPT